jgi:hypothetical protein
VSATPNTRGTRLTAEAFEPQPIAVPRTDDDRDGWVTAKPAAPEPPRPTLKDHRATCIACRAGLGACEVGAALEREADELRENARARAIRDARIMRGERVDTPEPPYIFARYTTAKR